MKVTLLYLSKSWMVGLLAAGGILARHSFAADAFPSDAEGKQSPKIMHCSGPTLIPVAHPSPQPSFAAAAEDFTIVPVFDNTTSAAQRAVIQQAVNDWNAILQSRGINPGTWNVPISYTGSNAALLANTGVSYSIPSGALVSAGMTIFTNYNWYVDPNPADDTEFQSSPPAGFDLLTVVRHELGHAVGWIASPRVSNLVSGAVFDPPRLNIQMPVGDIQHADPSAHPGEVMQPAIAPSTRRGIRLYPTAALVSRAYDYLIPMHFIDPGFGGTETGTVWQPWRSLPAASSQSPGLPLLLAPTTHQVSREQTFATPHRWEAARGGAVVSAP
jgi:hypothetical protein